MRYSQRDNSLHLQEPVDKCWINRCIGDGRCYEDGFVRCKIGNRLQWCEAGGHGGWDGLSCGR